MTRARVRRPLILLTVLGLLAGLVGSPVAAAPPAGKGHPSNTAVFFASDGMRQDLVAKYAAQGLMPTMASFLKNGTSATGDGLLTEAPPNTGAGWYSLATGAWPGVHGSTNNTFHINGTNFANSTSAFASGIMQAESIAQSGAVVGNTAIDAAVASSVVVSEAIAHISGTTTVSAASFVREKRTLL